MTGRPGFDLIQEQRFFWNVVNSQGDEDIYCAVWG